MTKNQRITNVQRLMLWGCGLAIVAIASLSLGAADTTWSMLWRLLAGYDPSEPAQLVIVAMRIPRMVSAVLVGAALAVSGALMQGMTRNPLADPGLIGIEAGSAFAVVVGATWFGLRGTVEQAVLAVSGGLVTVLLVLSLAAFGGRMRVMVFIIAGTAVSVFVNALTSAVLLFDQRTMSEVRFWLAGGIAGRSWEMVRSVMPFFVVGFACAVVVSRHVTILTFGEDVARGLGLRTQRTQVMTVSAVVLLSGAAVALAGPIGFVGLVVPHMIRPWVGSDYHWLVPFAAVLGGGIMLVADIVARSMFAPLEVPVGVIMAVGGGVFFITIVRRWSKR